MYYPVGTSTIGYDPQGIPIERENAQISRDALFAMDQNFSIVLPNSTTRVAGAASVLPFGAEANIDNEEKWLSEQNDRKQHLHKTQIQR